ncbi:nuclease-related domain-containing protein [Pseudoalteromonas sp. SSDWG2]|uniref:nuclease-related domain-containing protein n=1 Tax=Pseudoalteromonas sp. SSDWG2 TaxID=3139391 RepID=UPI003BABE0D1
MKWIPLLACVLLSSPLYANDQYTESECILLQHQANDFSHNKLSVQYRSAKQKLDKHCINPKVFERTNQHIYVTNVAQKPMKNSNVNEPRVVQKMPKDIQRETHTYTYTQATYGLGLMFISVLMIGLFFLFCLGLIAVHRIALPFKLVNLGEWRVNQLLKVLTKRTDVSLYKNMLFKTKNGEWTEVDHLLVTPFGVFVIESKDYKGWIFGSEYQAQWTQSLIRLKTQFMNPLRQNFKHCKAVQEYLDVDKGIESLVVFGDRASFKTPMPANVVMLSDMTNYILSYREIVFTPEQLNMINVLLELREEATTEEDYREHIQQVKEIRARTQ